MPSSRLPGFHELDVDGRVERLVSEGWLDDAAATALVTDVPMSELDAFIENVVGRFTLPMGVATNFTVNGRDVLVPMVIEEPSVVAAASNAARMARPHGGFTAEAGEPVMIGQIVLTGVDAYRAREIVRSARDALLDEARGHASSMEARGGGITGLETRVVEPAHGEPVCVVHVLMDVRDAMGANAINALAEELGTTLADLTGGHTLLRILSNRADRRLVKVQATFDRDLLGGADVVRDVVHATELADADPYRAVTHNKGVMNGITAVVMATGNDTRAVEAAAHEWAIRGGHYGSLTHYDVTPDGHLRGTLELPMAVGTVGGATTAHPHARAAMGLLNVDGARELAEIVAAVGLAQNVAAVRALVAEGIQAGHMRLHARKERLDPD